MKRIGCGSAVVLAGGRSLRMGRPKAGLGFGAGTLLERVVVELSRRFSDVVIVAAPRRIERLTTIRSSARLRIVHDETAYPGPVAALLRGLEAIEDEAAFACSCDLPTLKADLAAELAGMLEAYDAVVPEIGGRLEPLHAVYHRRCTAELMRMERSGEKRLHRLAEAINTRRVGEAELRRLDPELESFFNLNTPEDYRRALDATCGRG